MSKVNSTNPSVVTLPRKDLKLLLYKLDRALLSLSSYDSKLADHIGRLNTVPKQE